MDFTDPPQGAHTSHLRTLSKIKGLREVLVPAPEDISSEGAAYYTTISRTVNTFSSSFSSRWRDCDDGAAPSSSRAFRPARRRGANPNDRKRNWEGVSRRNFRVAAWTVCRTRPEARFEVAFNRPESGARARIRACRAAADAPIPQRAADRAPRRPRHRREPHARRACASPPTSSARAPRL